MTMTIRNVSNNNHCRSGNLVALKTERNQVTIYDLKNNNNSNNNSTSSTTVDSGESIAEKATIQCDSSSSINSFTINDKDNLVAIVLESNNNNRTIILYDVTMNRKIEHQGQIKCFSFQVLFIHLGALWMGSLNTKADQILLEFNIQQINDFTLMNCSSKTDQLALMEDSSILTYHVNKDLLLIVYKCDDSSKIVHYQLLDSRDVKQRKFWLIKKHVPFIRSNYNNSLILFITEDFVIHLIDGDQPFIEFRLQTEFPLNEIDFDMSNHFCFCVSTNKTFHFCFYSQEKRKCFRHDSKTAELSNESASLNNVSSSSTMIAYKIPYIYLWKKDNPVSALKHKALLTFQNRRQVLERLLTANPNEFKKGLYDCKIEDENLWRILAKKSIMERDIHCAMICSARMGDAGLVRCLRQEMATNPLVVCFLLMIHLDLMEESDEVLKEIQLEDNYSVSKLYSLQEKWTQAFECADKIELKNLYYQFARQMEMDNKILEAIVYYEQSGNVSQVVRMLFESENIADLKNYCLKKQTSDGKLNKNLVSWWGQYCESQGDHSTAVDMYKLADDYYNLVRILCHMGQVEQAIELVDEHLNNRAKDDKPSSGMTAAILFLGKHLELVDSLQSIEYYLQCSAIRHAFRVCVAHEHFDKMAEIAIRHTSTVNDARNILDTYFPDEKSFKDKMVHEENAAMLYYKADKIKQSILYSVKHRLWTFLRQILPQELDKEQRNFLVQQEEIDLILGYLKEDASIIDIVIDLILMADAKHFDSITEVINQYGIDLNDDLMNKLEMMTNKNHNQALMNTIAELCLQKGNYQLAAKLYNKIGKRVDSLKSLIRTGQADKIIQFANVARDKTVFKLAANFLQTINYEDCDQVIKFYTKAAAYDELERYKQQQQQQTTSINHPEEEQ